MNEELRAFQRDAARVTTPKYRTDANACSCLGYWMAWDTRRGGNGAVRYAGGAWYGTAGAARGPYTAS